MFDRARQFLNGVDPDMKIYRVFPFWRALQLFQTKTLVLVRPALWDDPFENFLLNAKVEFPDGSQASLETIRDAWYGQCWTGQTESDAMWRIYSGDKTGVRLSTTAGKLFNAVCATPDQWSPLQYFIGRVAYHPQATILSFFDELTFADLTAGGQNYDLAQSLLIKRETFEHEKEVRILHFDTDARRSGKAVEFSIDPPTLIDDVMLDPRLDASMVATISAALNSAGHTGPILQSDLYRMPSLTIQSG
jgi:hypothetical protein